MKAIPVSPGLAMGKVYKMPEQKNHSHIPRIVENSEVELQKLNLAISNALLEMKEIVSRLNKSSQNQQAEIFEAHALMIEDPELVDRAKDLILQGKLSAVWAYKEASDEFAGMLAGLEDSYLRERAADVKDIASRVMAHLLGQKSINLENVPPNSILIAEDISPSQMASLNPKLVKGIITELGGKTSHTAIIARALEIPALAGASGIMAQVEDSNLVLLDALSGEIEIEPSIESCLAFEKKIQELSKSKAELNQYKNLKSETRDKKCILLGANIGGHLDIPSLIENDAEAVGLYRTEFVFLNHNRIPSRKEQYQAYREVFEALGTKHCVIRTLDIGGDKQLEGLSVAAEMNPFLGLRGIRLCLQERGIFKDQIKAILMAGLGHSIGIMIPMISNIEEILQTKSVLNECEQELKAEGKLFCQDYQFGVMIEVPSAAMIVDLIAKHVDFISIGTNDLTQYVCAVDRLNDKVEKLYDPFNPGFLRIMNRILSAASEVQLHSGICGSLAHSELLVPLFIGMGVNELSMTSQHLLSTRRLVRSLSFVDCKLLVKKVMSFETSFEIKSCLEEFSQNLSLQISADSMIPNEKKLGLV